MGSTTSFKGLDDWHVVQQLLPEGWQAAARTLGALRRGREIADPETLLRVLLVHLADGCSLQETALRVGEAGLCSVSAVALFKRLAASRHWLRWMAERLWRQRVGDVEATPYRMRVVDATTVQEPGSTGTDWRVHYVIRLENLQCDHFEVTDAKGGETLRRIPVAAGDLMMGDRCYGTASGVAHVKRAGGEVLVRISPRNLPLFKANGAKLPVLARLRTLKVGQVGAWPAQVMYHGEAIAGRLVAVKRGAQATRLAQRRLQRKASKNGHALTARAMEAAAYVCVWTSVPSEQMSALAVMGAYRLRWQIELSFRRMKSILGLGHLPKWSDESAAAWIHGKLLIAMLIERLLDAADDFSPWGYRLDPAPQPMA